MALHYRERMEREVARLVDARRRLVHSGRHETTDVRVCVVAGKGQYIAAADLSRYHVLTREVERVEAKLAVPSRILGPADPDQAPAGRTHTRPLGRRIQPPRRRTPRPHRPWRPS